MNAVDIAILIFLVAALVYGLVRGFVRIALGIAGLAVTLAAALRLSASGPGWFGGIFSSPQVARVFAFVLVLVVGLLVTGLIAWLAHKLVDYAQIGWIDRLVGGTIGLVGGSFIVCVALVAATTFLPEKTALIAGSRLAPTALRVGDMAALILPEPLAAAYRTKRDALWHKAPPADEKAKTKTAEAKGGAAGKVRHP